MKNSILKIFLCVLIVTLSLCMASCTEKVYPQNIVYQDDQKTGGNLSFYYDEISHTAVFGGEGEVIAFYQKDLTKGWNKEGNRVGIKIIAPSSVKDYDSGWAKVGDEEIKNGEFYQVVNGEKSNQANFYPIIDENFFCNIEICWEEGSKPQNYQVKIVEGTILSEK